MDDKELEYEMMAYVLKMVRDKKLSPRSTILTFMDIVTMVFARVGDSMPETNFREFAADLEQFCRHI